MRNQRPATQATKAGKATKVAQGMKRPERTRAEATSAKDTMVSATEDTPRVSFRISKEMHKQLKLEAAQRECTLGDILAEAVKQYLETK